MNNINKLVVGISIIGFIVCIILMFMTTNAMTMQIYGATSIFCIFNSVGTTLIIRRRKPGLILNLICAVGLTIAIVLCRTTYERFPIFMIVILSLIWASIVLTCVPPFICKSSDSRGSIWNGMKSGLDYAHARHIYQLSSFFLVIVVALMIFYKPKETGSVRIADNIMTDPYKDITEETPTIERKEKPTGEENSKDNSDENSVEDMNSDWMMRLNSTDITLNEVTQLESTLKPEDLTPKNKARIFALKHLLLSGLSGKPNVSKLRDIISIHFDEYSNEQQAILNWFLKLPNDEKLLWEECQPTDNLKSFKQVLENKIKAVSKKKTTEKPVNSQKKKAVDHPKDDATPTMPSSGQGNNYPNGRALDENRGLNRN